MNAALRPQRFRFTDGHIYEWSPGVRDYRHYSFCPCYEIEELEGRLERLRAENRRMFLQVEDWKRHQPILEENASLRKQVDCGSGDDMPCDFVGGFCLRHAMRNNGEIREAFLKLKESATKDREDLAWAYAKLDEVRRILEKANILPLPQKPVPP
jgi:hypothetical protein